MLLLLILACSPAIQTNGPVIGNGQLENAQLIATDGYELPLRTWKTPNTPEAIIIALHGFNDYSNAFSSPAGWWQKAGIMTLAYDQRGFGETSQTGIWAGNDRLIDDLALSVNLVRQANPGVPVYLLGESMGGGVVMAALGRKNFPVVDGAILSAPAVWGWKSLNPFYKASLWIGAHIFPANTVTGSGLGIQASDNIPMLKALGKDPLFIKETRIDAVYGLVGIMDRAADAAALIKSPLLLLYGAKDEVIPKDSVEAVAAKLGRNATMVVYDEGWHMLLRDLQAKRVWQDIVAWIKNREIPSGSTVNSLPLFQN